jgi:hypothetical protein
LPAARAALADALQQAQALGSREIEAECARVQAALALQDGAVEEAQAAAARAQAISNAAADRRGSADALRWRGRAALAAGRLDEAARHLGQALPELLAQEMREEALGCVDDLAQLAWARGRAAQALQMAAAADKFRLRLGIDRLPAETRHWRAWTQEALAAAGIEAAEAACLEGQRWEMEAATVKRLLAAAD